MAYTMGNVNYNDQIQQLLVMYGQGWRATDYSLNQFQAMAQGGLDFKVATNVSIGAAYKFLKPIASNESQDGLYSGFYYPYPGFASADYAKQAFRGTIRDSNVSVFQVSASVTF
jgi:hypothetical protein